MTGGVTLLAAGGEENGADSGGRETGPCAGFGRGLILVPGAFYYFLNFFLLFFSENFCVSLQKRLQIVLKQFLGFVK
jgi:hypothetical protein